MAYLWMNTAGLAKNYLGLYEQAIPWFRRAIEANRNFWWPHILSGVALAQLGRLDEASTAVKAGLALNPTYSISRSRALSAALSDDPTVLAGYERILEGLRKAGVPE
jgi:Flp pilus assembly protein TadD